jgi:hypothetical protein
MASADGELFKDVFVIDGVDMHEEDDGAGGVKKTKEKKFDKGKATIFSFTCSSNPLVSAFQESCLTLRFMRPL